MSSSTVPVRSPTMPSHASASTASTSSTSSTSSSSSASSASSRPRKLQSMGPLHIPVPPTLQNSPHLHSPTSVFRRPYNANRTPGEEDERWLGDTVPVPSGAHAHAHPSGTGHIHTLGHGGKTANLSGHGHGHGHTMTKGPGSINSGHAHPRTDYFDRAPGHEGSSSREAKLLSAVQQAASRT